VRAVLRLCGVYPVICLTTEEKARKNFSQSMEKHQPARKNLKIKLKKFYNAVFSKIFKKKIPHPLQFNKDFIKPPSRSLT
jgi:hypothetical protein